MDYVAIISEDANIWYGLYPAMDRHINHLIDLGEL